MGKKEAQTEEEAEAARAKDRERKNEARAKMPPPKLDDLRRSERLRKTQAREELSID